MVGDHVVQLTGDAHPLVEHGPAGVLLPLALELGGAQLRAHARFASGSDRDAESPEHPEDGEAEDEIVGEAQHGAVLVEVGEERAGELDGERDEHDGEHP